jgi:hypothetical protein
MGRIKFSDAISHFNKWAPRIILTLLALMVVTGLGSAILTAYFGVPIGDDYLAIKTFSNKHTWLVESWNSLTHTGRYMQSITSSLGYGIFRSKSAVILPLIVMAWVFVLTYLYIKIGGKKLKIKIGTSNNLMISASILFLLLNFGRPSDPHNIWLFFQPYFFTSAIVTYTIGFLIYLTFLYVLLASKKVAKLSDLKYSILIFIVTYILSLYNETSPATILGLSSLGIVVDLSIKKQRGRLFYALASTASASLLALVTMYLSPANQARRHAIGAQTTLGDMYTGIVHNLQTMLSSFLLRPSDIITILALGAVICTILAPKITAVVKSSRPILIAGIATVASGILSLIASLTLATIGYGVSPNVYPRTLFIPEVLLVVGFVMVAVSLWVAVGSYTSSKPYASGVFMLAMLLGTLLITPHSISRTAGHLTGVQDYNAVWQRQDQELREWAQVSPNKTIYLDDEGAGISDGFSTRCTGPNAASTSWLSDGMEAYYGVKKICATSDEVK